MFDNSSQPVRGSEHTTSGITEQVHTDIDLEDSLLIVRSNQVTTASKRTSYLSELKEGRVLNCCRGAEVPGLENHSVDTTDTTESGDCREEPEELEL